MALTDPGTHRDRTEDWMAFWHERRKAALLALVTADLIEEHRRDPIGVEKDHSHDLRRVLTYLRMAPTVGKDFIHASIPFQEFQIGVISPRDHEVDFPPLARFASPGAAGHAVFLRRLASIGVDVDALEGK
jgi:branched-chain amino acid transport system permease protein